jgi:hypothetical protein
MHSGDVHGMIEPELRGDRACTQCHEEIARDVRAHTHHDPAGAGSRCLECHMPRMVYGIVDIHRSHRIESPDVARDVEAGRPNACTSCHTGETALWAANAMREAGASSTVRRDRGRMVRRSTSRRRSRACTRATRCSVRCTRGNWGGRTRRRNRNSAPWHLRTSRSRWRMAIRAFERSRGVR